jgi:hypothetical protein
VYAYYPTPYPVYYYPYPPGAAFASGVIWGAAIASAWRPSYEHYRINSNVNINRNVNINTGNINRGNINVNRPTQLPAQGTAWSPAQTRGQIASGRVTPPSTTNTANTRAPISGGAAGRQLGGAQGAPVGTPNARPGGTAQTATASRGQPTTFSAGGQGVASLQTRAGTSDAFSGVGSGRAANFDSQRGAASQAQATRTGGRPAGARSSR